MNPLNLNMHRIFKCDEKTLFDSIGEGALFLFTGAQKDKMKMDFKVGGELELRWGECDAIRGEFLEIDPHNKIVFSWNTFDEKMLSKVTIKIAEKDAVSTLTLLHEGNLSEEIVGKLEHGWDNSLGDLRKSLEN